MVKWNKDKLLERVQEVLITNFVGVTIINRNNAYDKIGVVIPVCEVKIEPRTPNDDNTVVDAVTVDFGSIRCVYHFEWAISSVSKPVKFRLTKILPQLEELHKDLL